MEKGSKKRDRPNAFRSCRKCKEQKRRCELNEKVLLIEPSNEPLQKSDACNRCHILALPCILDDFEKIEKIAIKKRKEELVKKDSNENQERVHNIPLIESNSIITNNINSNTPSSSSITTSTGFDIFPTDSQDFKRYTPRSRPITLVSELSIRQPNFAKFRFDENENQHDCYDLIDDFLGHKLSIWCENNLLIWLPGLIKPDQIRKSRKQNQPLSASIRIIELSQYLIAIQHSSSIQFKDEKEKDFLLLNLTKKIESFLSQLFLGSQRDLYASQALELLSVFPIASSYLNYYSSSQSNGNDKKIESLEVSVLSSSANRIASSCKQEYVLYKWQKEQEEQEEEEGNNNLDILDENDELEEESKKITAREFELRIQWCSCSAWEFSHCMGSNDIIKFYGVRSTPDLFQVNKLLLYFRSNPTPGLRGLGQLFVLLRSHLMACVLLSWEKLHDETPFALSRIKRIPKRTTTERLKILGKILEDHENRCEQSKAIRYSWLESHKSPQAQLLLTWLDMEDLAHSLMISGRTLFYALHKDENDKKIFNFTPKVLFQLINDSGKEDICSKEVRKFIFYHGDNRNDSAESLLMIASSLPSHSTSPQMEFFIPILTTCGFIMEASMLSMEVHGTSARYWQSLPKRSRQWQMGMKGSIEMLNKLKDVEEQKGGISPTISRILTGMYEVITIWSRAINKSLITQNSLIQNQQIQSKENNNESTTTNTNTNLNPINNLPSTVEDQNKVAGIDVSIPPLATDGEQISLDQLLREMFGSTDWLDVLPSVQGGRLK